jgi:hypothetical protein
VQGQPTRFIRGHNRKTVGTRARTKVAAQFCDCGCGQPTKIATKTDARWRSVKGQPRRYINGHNPLEVKLCECGCGQTTPIAKETDRRRGAVKGEPYRFVRGHGGLVHARAARGLPALAPPAVPAAAGRARALYAEDLLHLTEQIVGAIHFDGPDEIRAHVAAALRLAPPPGVNPVEALVTVLAAQIDPDTTAEQRLGWVRAFDRGAAQAPTPPRQLPVRASPRKETAA